VVIESIFEALQSIFEAGFEFFDVFRLGLAGNEETCQKWCVTVGSVIASECRCQRGEGEEEEKKNQGMRWVF
jgi:hypothetical protein